MCQKEVKQLSNTANHSNGNGNCKGNGAKSNGNCSGNGVKTNGNGVQSNGNGNYHSSSSTDVVISLNRGDPKVYYKFWKNVDNKCKVTIKASELMSYFGDYDEGGVFYQLPEFTDAVRQVHRVVGNAVTEGRYIIGGTGSSQLFTVALRALASSVSTATTKKKRQIPVVCAEPYYSCYEEALEEEKSELYKWQGDANTFDEEGPYVEVVTTPNNPDGRIQEPVVKKKGGLVICDLAYYWPQYTPITAPADYDVMLFTLSKATGHAGSRVGWAIVKDKSIAARMINLMSLITIGSCHEGQLRAAKILKFVADSYEHPANSKLGNDKFASGKLGNGELGNGKLGNSELSNGKLARGKLGNGKLARGKLGNGKLGNGELGNGKLGNNELGNGKFASGKLGNGKLGNGKLGNGKFASGKLGNGELANGKIGNGELANGKTEVEQPMEKFFEFSHHVLADRWEKLRAAVKRCGVFNLPDYSPEYCNFMNKTTYPNPAYAWMELKTGEDAEKWLKELKITTRAGPRFGASAKYTRVSMLESDETFNQFLERISAHE